MKKIMIVIVSLLLCSTVCFANTTSLTLMLDWYENPNHAPIFVAQHHGFSKKNGLRITIVTPSDPNDPIKLVAAKKIDIGLTYQSALLFAINQGLPINYIGSLIDQPLAAIAVLKNSNIQSIHDLQGKRIGYSSEGADRILIAGILNYAGLDLTEVTLINVHYNLVQALLSKQVDAISGVMRNVEPIELESSGYPVRLFVPEKNGIPSYDELIYIVNTKITHQATIERFLTAMKEATQYLKQHPKAMWKAFIKRYPELNNPVNQQSWFNTLPYFAENPGQLDQKKFDRYSIFFNQYPKKR